jgi:hypothetical protein
LRRDDPVCGAVGLTSNAVFIFCRPNLGYTVN